MGETEDQTTQENNGDKPVEIEDKEAKLRQESKVGTEAGGPPPTNAERAQAKEAAKEEAEEEKSPEAEDEAASEEDETETEKSPEYDPEVWGSTGDEVGDSVLGVLASSGISTDDAKALLFEAVANQDLDRIDQAALVEKVGKDRATLVMAGVKDFVTRKSAELTATKESVYAVAGGEENWNKVREWARSNVSEADRASYAAMFDAGGAQARFAATEMLTAYNSKSGGAPINTGDTLRGDSRGKTSVKPISKREYAEQLQKAYRNGGDPNEIARIQRARVAGRNKGI